MLLVMKVLKGSMNSSFFSNGSSLARFWRSLDTSTRARLMSVPGVSIWGKTN